MGGPPSGPVQPEPTPIPAPPEREGEDDDELEASRAPLLDHLIELRKRIIWALLAVGAGFGLCFAFAGQIYAILLIPFSEAAAGVAAQKGLEQEELTLIFTAPLEYFFVKLRLAVFGGVILAFPFIAYQVYAFVAPGLYKNERKVAAPFMIAAPALFSLGAALVYFFILPFVMRFALNQQQVVEGAAVIELLPRVSEYLILVTTLILAFGFAFQLPVVLTLLAMANMIGAETLRKGRRYAIVGIFAFAAFATPPDPLSQIGLGLAVMALYEISIFVVAMVERRREAADRAAEAAAE